MRVEMELPGYLHRELREELAVEVRAVPEPEEMQQLQLAEPEQAEAEEMEQAELLTALLERPVLFMAAVVLEEKQIRVQIEPVAPEQRGK